MKPLSLDLKERIVAAHQAHPLAQRFLTTQSTVSVILAKHHKQESLAPKKKPSRPRKISEEELKKLEKSVAQRNDRTLEEHVAVLTQDGILVSDSTVSRRLQDLKLTRKKDSP